MLVDQTMAEVSASGGAYRDYLRFTRAAVARQMRAFGLEFEFCAAEPDGIRVLPTLSAPTEGSICSPLIRCAAAVSHRRRDVRHSR